jgi:RNA polymerase-binding transcription factor DksA
MRKPILNTSELRAYRHQLDDLIARLSGDVSELRGQALRPVGAEGGGDSEHEADPGTLVEEGDLALGLLGSEEAVLADATAALARIEQGTFGRCEGCDKPIARARLDALPYARYCVRCARTAGSGTDGCG